MTKREQFLDYVRHGGRPICSPQIGGGAGFDTKVAGKEWVHDTTIEDTLAVVERFDILPLLNFGLWDFMDHDPRLRWRKVRRELREERIYEDFALDTPKGTLTRKSFEEKRSGGCQYKYAVEEIEELDAFEWVLDRALELDLSPVAGYVRGLVEKIDGRGAVSIQWSAQPYDMLSFADTVHTVLLAMDRPEQFRRLLEKIFLIDLKLIDRVAEGGGDFIFLGGPAKEAISPGMFEEFLIPYSQRVSAAAHERGLLVYSHVCSPIEPFLSMGFYNRWNVDLFETLSPPPVGNVASLKDAMEKLDPRICTRGNLGLDVLLNGSVTTVREKTREILDATRGRKHIVAASDYLFYGIPEANVRAMVEAVRDWGKEI